jgi:hypothetical protein
MINQVEPFPLSPRHREAVYMRNYRKSHFLGQPVLLCDVILGSSVYFHSHPPLSHSPFRSVLSRSFSDNKARDDHSASHPKTSPGQYFLLFYFAISSRLLHNFTVSNMWPWSALQRVYKKATSSPLCSLSPAIPFRIFIAFEISFSLAFEHSTVE